MAKKRSADAAAASSERQARIKAGTASDADYELEGLEAPRGTMTGETAAEGQRWPGDRPFGFSGGMQPGDFYEITDPAQVAGAEQVQRALGNRALIDRFNPQFGQRGWGFLERLVDAQAQIEAMESMREAQKKAPAPARGGMVSGGGGGAGGAGIFSGGRAPAPAPSRGVGAGGMRATGGGGGGGSPMGVMLQRRLPGLVS
jgi:hypothetical protein